MAFSPQANAVTLSGKISRVGTIAYTPTGLPVVEFTLACAQRYFDKDSMGNFEVLAVGDLVEAARDFLRIGRRVSVTGSLWTRTYKNRQDLKVNEIKVLAVTIGGNE